MRGTLLLALLAGLTALMVVGQVFQAPDWLRTRVEARLDRALGGFRIDFGTVYVVIHKGWRPRIQLHDVRLSDPQGRIIAQLADAEASLAMRPLLRGSVQPKRISLNGAFATLRRDENGMLSLSLSSAGAPLEQAPSLPEMVEALDNVFLRPEFQALTSMELDAITLSYEDLRQGRAWTLDGGRVQVTRGGDDLRIATGFSLLSGRDYASEIEANYTSVLGAPTASFGISITDLAAEDVAMQSPAVAWLQVLRAPISGAVRGSIDASGALGQVSATLQIDAGVIQPNPNTRPVPFDMARTYLTYDPSDQRLRFDEVSVNSAWISAVAEGTAYLDGVEDGTLRNLAGQFSLTDLRANPAGVYSTPVAIDRAELDFQMKLEPFHVQLGRATIEHEGRTLRLDGNLRAPREGWDLSLDAQLDRIEPAQILSYWPETVAEKPRKWVSDNLTRAQMTDLDLAVRLRPGSPLDLYADFDFADATIRFARTLPPLVRTQGHANLVGRRFSVTAHRGYVQPDNGDEIDAAGSSFIIPDIGIRQAAPGIARIRAEGSVTSLLSLLNRPPLQLLDKANLPVDVADGAAKLAGTLSLPLKDKVQISDMQFHLNGSISDMRSTRLVPDHDVSAAALRVAGDQSQITVSGDGFFGDVPMQAKWQQPIGKGEAARSTLTGEIELSPALIQELGAGLPPGMVGGQGVADVTVGIGGGQPVRLAATSDLAGVRLSLPELSWVKPSSSPGNFEIAAVLGKGGRIESIAIDGAGLQARGEITFDENQQMDRARFPTFRLRNWLSVPLELVGRGARAPDINILGGSVDMRSATFGSSGSGQSGGGSAPALSVALNRLQISDTIALSDFRGDFSTAGGVSGNFTGSLNGQAPIKGQVLRRGGRNGFFLEAGDAGAVFRAAQVLDQAHGGSFQLALEPTEGDGVYDAILKVRNTKVRDAPAMAALLNAVSLVGLLDEMSGQGIQFSNIDGRMRVTPTSVTIYQGSAVGPSIGLSVDGHVDTEQRRLDLRGVISPIYLLNAIGSVLTRPGEGLIGFNYTLTGPMGKPQVFVNPLSGLTPGFLRDIMREPAPKVPPTNGDGLFPPQTERVPVENTGGDR